MPPRKETVQNAPAQMSIPADLQWFEEPEVEEGAAPKPNAELEAMREQLAELRGELTATRQQQAYQPFQKQAAPEVPEISYEDLPDPLVDARGYAREVASRTKAHFDAQRKREAFEAQQSQQETSRYSALWDQFADKYADQAANTDLTEFATRKVINSYAQKGIDVNRAMFGDTDTFFKDVAGEIDRITGKQIKTAADDDDDDIRTEGMFGGMESGGKAGSTKSEGAPKRPPSMFDGIADWQVKNGFY